MIKIPSPNLASQTASVKYVIKNVLVRVAGWKSVKIANVLSIKISKKSNSMRMWDFITVIFQST